MNCPPNCLGFFSWAVERNRRISLAFSIYFLVYNLGQLNHLMGKVEQEIEAETRRDLIISVKQERSEHMEQTFLLGIRVHL